MKTSLKEKRQKAVYNIVNASTSSQRDKVLDILMATATDRQFKIVCEELGIKLKK